MRQSDLHGDMKSTAEMTVPRETNQRESIVTVSRSNKE